MSSPFKICRRFAQELFKKLAVSADLLISDSTVQNDSQTSSDHENTTKNKQQIDLKNQIATRCIQDLILDSYAYFILGIHSRYLIGFQNIDQKIFDQLKSRFIHLASRLEPFKLSYVEQIKLFGIVYEGILNLDLDYLNQEYKVVKNDQRRRLGAHYTPSSLGAMMNQRVIDLLKAQSQVPLGSKLLLSLRVCDPSAGAGGILLDYATQISDLIISSQKTERENDPSRIKQTQELSVPVQVVRECLYAHDLDQRALRVCRLSLLALAHGAQHREEALGLTRKKTHNKKPNNKRKCTLAYRESDQTWTLLHQHVVAHNALQELKTWHDLHPEIFNSERFGFDLVIGNPPYVSMYGRGSQARHFDDSFLEQIQRDYGHIDGHSVLSGRLNLFLSFMVLSTNLLNNTKSLAPLVSLILPDTMITNEAYSAMREGLCLSGRLIEVQRHDVDLFKGANVGISVVIWGDKLQNKQQIFSKDSSKQENQANSRKVILRDLSDRQELIIKESHQKLLVRNLCSWWPCSNYDLDRAMMSKVSSVLLSEVANIKDGFNTGSASRRQSLLIRKSKLTSRLKDTPKSSRFCLEGKWITPFQIQKQALWIKNTALDHLASAKRFNQKKIIYRQTASHIIAAVDLDGLVYLNSAHAIILHQEYEDSLFALCAYLNSEAFKQRYRLISGETRRTFPQVHISTVKQIRVPQLLFNPQHPHCVHLTELANALSKPNNEAQKESLLAKLNQRVSLIHKDLFS